MEKINLLVLESLNKGDFSSAQRLFRQNAKGNPCHKTLNNLGCFYANEGLELPNGRVRGAIKLGYKYLNLAEQCFQSHKNLSAIGDIHFSWKDYVLAANYFKRSYNLQDNYLYANNYAASEYMQGNYMKASKYFKTAFDSCNNSDDRFEIYISYAYALIKVDMEKCLKIVHDAIESYDSYHMEMDEFILAYFCEDFIFAASLIKRMFDYWSIDDHVLAMVFECLFKLNRGEEANEFLQLQIKSLQGYDYNTNKRVKSAKLMFSNAEYRKSLISEYKYIAPIIKGCYYIDCALHNQF